ncbi:MAG: hybrid sensor histidine kinase/response regulator [Chitinophagaceae bacterium]|nr:MAG: hybrid sensor histidine kinase/response regulator [Chitinophagaceae bacterium]
MEKILLVEDEVIIRASIAEILRHYEYEVVVAENGKQGLIKALAEKPDLIVCDVMMPEMDGFEMLSELRKQTGFDTPFIFLTAKVQSDDIREGMNLGADDYIFKPFKSADLVKAIETRLDKRRQVLVKITEKTRELENVIRLMIGHEFNTPMNGIKAMSEFIHQNVEKYNDAELLEFSNYLSVSAARLQATFEKVRKVFEIKEFDKQDAADEKCPMVTNTIVQITRSLAEKAGRLHDLVIGNLGDMDLPIKSNLLFTALYEIIENAFKFSKMGTEVLIEAHRSANTYEISVTDRGDTITAEELTSYKSFKQFDRSKYEQQGLGAGLALTISILEKYDATISFTNNSPNGIKAGLIFKI